MKLIGQGDVGKVYLVRLKDSTHYFAMKVLSKQEMIQRNKVRLFRLFITCSFLAFEIRVRELNIFFAAYRQC